MEFFLGLHIYVLKVCQVFVPDRQIYFFPLFQWLETVHHFETFFSNNFDKKISSFDLGQLIMPRVISPDMRAAIWAHHQNGLSGQKLQNPSYFTGCLLRNRVSRNFVAAELINQLRQSAPRRARIPCWYSVLIAMKMSWNQKEKLLNITHWNEVIIRTITSLHLLSLWWNLIKRWHGLNPLIASFIFHIFKFSRNQCHVNATVIEIN